MRASIAVALSTSAGTALKSLETLASLKPLS